MQKPSYLPGLDGVRGIAALLIMFLHFMPNYNQAEHPFLFLLKKISILGQIGVPLFFVLSGFLITRILISSKNESNYFKQFYIKRALRIFPLYYLYLLINFFIIPIFNGQRIIDWNLTKYYYLYLQNVAMTFNWKHADLPHLWSLAVEEHFYFIWPIIIYFSSDKQILKIISACIVTAILCRIILVYLGFGTFYFTFTTFDALAIGAFLSLNELYKWLNKKHLLQILFLTIIPLIVAFPLLNGMGNNWVQYLKNLIISLFCMAVIGLVIQGKTKLNSFFEHPFLKYTGKISYGLYVFHPSCYALVNTYFHFNKFLLNLILCFSSAYVVATLSYYFFELKFLKLKSKLELAPVKSLV